MAPEDGSVEQRLQSLETAVERLERMLQGLIDDRLADQERRTRPRPAPMSRPAPRAATTPSQPAASTGAEPRPAPHPATPSSTRGPFEALLDRGPQFWISRVGIGLLLVGVVFVFKYAVDQGWLTPPIRVFFGLALGATLATIGFQVAERQRWFSQIMLGGASATWYITGFAAYQLLEVVSYPVAFGFMVLVTVFTFAVSVRQGEASLAVLGAVGGLGTPFFLYTEAGSVPELMGYTGIVLLGTSAIYLFKGWRSLLWTTAAGGWLVVALAFHPDSHANRLALQAGILLIWLLFWLVPVCREALAERNPALARPAEKAPGQRDDDLAVLVFAIAIITLQTSREVWKVDDNLWGLIALAAVPLYALGAVWLNRARGVAVLVSAHLVTAAALTAFALFLLLQGHLLLVLWAVLAVALHLLAHRLNDLPVRITAHLLFAVVGFWLMQRLGGEAAPDQAVWNLRALCDAAVIAAALVTTLWTEQDAVPWYLLAAHAAILGWLWRELATLPGGDALVTASWGVYGLALLLLLRKARNVGLATLFLAVGKLVLFDMREVDAIWRILLFLSFGGVFLAISYYFRSLWEDGQTDRR